MRVIRGRVFFRGQLEPLSLGIDEDGRIAAIKKVLRGDEEIDHGDALILPGCVDLHVHMRDPGLTEKEDFPSGTRSAALGGVTTVADMPNTKPPVTTRRTFEEKVATLKGRSAVDYALHAAPRSADAVPRLASAAAFKIYMAESTGGLELDLATAAEVLGAAGSANKLVVVHAEDPTKFTKSRTQDLKGHSDGRPASGEVSALAALERIRGSSKVHIAHITCIEVLDAAPAGATTEVSPHHLFLDWSNPLGARAKVNPPLRSREDREALWDAFRKGRIDIVASDHAPHTLEEKQQPFDEAPAGVPGVASSFPILMRRSRAGDLELGRLVSAMSTRPSEILGIRKGSIEIGREADLIALDPRRVERITAKRLRYKCGWTPFEGMEACFPRAVYLRGEPIIEEGEPTAEGLGRRLESMP